MVKFIGIFVLIVAPLIFGACDLKSGHHGEASISAQNATVLLIASAEGLTTPDLNRENLNDGRITFGPLRFIDPATRFDIQPLATVPTFSLADLAAGRSITLATFNLPEGTYQGPFVSTATFLSQFENGRERTEIINVLLETQSFTLRQGDRLTLTLLVEGLPARIDPFRGLEEIRIASRQSTLPGQNATSNQASGQIIGLVMERDLQGDQVPLPGAQLIAIGTNTSQTVTTDAEGRFLFPALAPDTYRLLLVPIAGPAREVPPVQLAAGGSTVLNLVKDDLQLADACPSPLFDDEIDHRALFAEMGALHRELKPMP